MIELLETLSRLLYAAVFVFHAAAWHWSTGRSQARGPTFFGARANASFAESEVGRAILRTFRWRLWSSAIALAIAAGRFTGG